MLKINTSDSRPLILTPELTRPFVYLDYGVIAALAKNSVQGPQLRNGLLEKGGTLYLGWAHLVELFGLGVGPTYNAIHAYLASFERSFVLIENIPRVVIDREAARQPGMQNPVINEDLLRELGRNWIGTTDLTVATLLDVMAEDESFIPKYQTMHRKFKNKLKAEFDARRHEYRTNPQERDRIDNQTFSHVPNTPPTDYIYKQIVRECITTNEQFNPTDVLDLHHCVVPLAYCDYVVLDNQWARRCGTIDIPPVAAKVFSSIQVTELIQTLASWPQGNNSANS